MSQIESNFGEIAYYLSSFRQKIILQDPRLEIIEIDPGAARQAMRLNIVQVQAIRQATNTAFGDGTPVWLFGSRVDDGKKGGDIDLLVRPLPDVATDSGESSQAFAQIIKMLTLLESMLDERKIDLVIEHSHDTRPIVDVAHNAGIRLQFNKHSRSSTLWPYARAVPTLCKTAPPNALNAYKPQPRLQGSY